MDQTAPAKSFEKVLKRLNRIITYNKKKNPNVGGMLFLMVSVLMKEGDKRDWDENSNETKSSELVIVP